MKRISLSSVIIGLSLLAAGFGLGSASAAVIKAGGGTALGLVTIINTGSTNSSGYTVKVYAGGQSEITINRPPSVRKGLVSRKLASDLFGAIHAAESNGRPSGADACMKSASFGSTMRVKYSTFTSADLNCPVIGANAKLRDQVNKILDALKVHPAVGQFRTLPGNEPRRMEGPPVTAPAPTPTP
ncbi:MAG: hypothetical protein ABR584_02395 [Candidatus Baltobacteraceae bacterium]